MSNHKPPWWVYKQRAKAKKSAQTLPMRKPRRNKVFQSREARQVRKNTPEYMMNRRVPKTRRPQPLPLFRKQAPEQMPWWQSAYVSGSVMPEYVPSNANMLKLRQQNLPFGMKPRTIDAPDHY